MGFLRLAHILECGWWVGWVGGVGGMITFLGLAHILECGRGWVGGVGGMFTFLGLAHIVVYGCGGIPSTCTHTRVRVVGRVGGWGGWDDNVPWTCTHTRVRERVGGWGGWDVYVPWKAKTDRHQHKLWIAWRKTGRRLQLRNCTYNSLASTTTSFFAPYGLYSGPL